MSQKSSPNFSIHDPNFEIRQLLQKSVALAESRIGVRMSRSQVIRFLAMQWMNSSDSGYTIEPVERKDV